MKRDELRRYLAEQADCLALATDAFKTGPGERHRLLARAFGIHEKLASRLARALIEAEEEAGMREGESGLARGTADVTELAIEAANDERGDS
jgi:hypothetical protein